MVTYVLKIGIFVGILVAGVAFLKQIPAFAALSTTAIGCTTQFASVITAFTGFISTYGRPFIGFFNMIFGVQTARALFVLIVWKMTKPYVMAVVDLVYKLIGRLTKDA